MPGKLGKRYLIRSKALVTSSCPNCLYSILHEEKLERWPYPMNYVIWDSTDAFKHGFESPEFQAQLKHYPPGTEVSAFMFQRVAVPGMCLDEPVASD